MKYKKLYEETKGDLDWAKTDLKQLQRKINELEKEKTELKAIISTFEGRESDVRRENEWLKTTLRLVTVDGEKVKYLVNELENDVNSMSIRF